MLAISFVLLQLLPIFHHPRGRYSIALRTGNYDTYVRTRTELEENQMKQWQKEQDQVRPSDQCCYFFSGVCYAALPMYALVSRGANSAFMHIAHAF